VIFYIKGKIPEMGVARTFPRFAITYGLLTLFGRFFFFNEGLAHKGTPPCMSL
jgi:hypothetical protein